MTRKPLDAQTLHVSEAVAGNGLLDRRWFLRGGLAGAAALAASSVQAETLSVPPWMKQAGSPFTTYGQPSKFEEKVARSPGSRTGAPGTGSATSPLQLLNGTITPNGLHFERSHNGVPDIDPEAHRLLIHGLVKRSLVFTVDALERYPMVSRMSFIECAGNSGALAVPQAVPGNAQSIHGLVSCAEWTGVPLSILLDEAGVQPEAKWLLAEGADAAGMSRSVPLDKALDDVLIALYQNGERIRPSNGYPLRLLVPGFDGNINVKWLRRIKLVKEPVMTKDETSKYSMVLQDGRVAQFKLWMDAKSVITRPSPGLAMQGPGICEIAGLAWSGAARIKRVEVSADGGKSWADAALNEPILSKAFTRFRLPWRWNGGPAVLQSRATDETGYVQPTRDVLVAKRGMRTGYYWNAITSWSVSDSGDIKHVYA